MEATTGNRLDFIVVKMDSREWTTQVDGEAHQLIIRQAQNLQFLVRVICVDHQIEV